MSATRLLCFEQMTARRGADIYGCHASSRIAAGLAGRMAIAQNCLRSVSERLPVGRRRRPRVVKTACDWAPTWGFPHRQMTLGRLVRCRWRSRTRFIRDGRFEFNNNTVERPIRSISPQSQDWAVIASLINKHRTERQSKRFHVLYLLFFMSCRNAVAMPSAMPARQAWKDRSPAWQSVRLQKSIVIQA